MDSPFSSSSSSAPARASVFVIGDPHIKASNLSTARTMVEEVIRAAEMTRPAMIVCLGDLLDTHEIARVQPYNLACEFIDRLSQIARTYLIIGNHDYINNQQFLTSNHFFNPLKKWDNVVIVDTVTQASIGNCKFVLCPYVPPGRFEDALNVLYDKGVVWDVVTTCIFAHQEFRGAKFGATESVKGDLWPEGYPLVISGHIHDAQDVGDNIKYVGSVMQHAFGEKHNKAVWNVVFDTEGGNLFAIDKLKLNIRPKRIVYTSATDFEGLDPAMLDDTDVKVRVEGMPEQFSLIRKTPVYAELVRRGAVVQFVPQDSSPVRADEEKDDATEGEDEETAHDDDFDAIFRRRALTRCSITAKAYRAIFDDGSDDDATDSCELELAD